MQVAALLALAMLLLATTCTARHDQGLFGNNIQLPDGARSLSTGLSTRLQDLVQRRVLLGSSSYGYYYGGEGGYGT